MFIGERILLNTVSDSVPCEVEGEIFGENKN